MRLTVCLPSTGDLLRDHSEVCNSSVCFYITLWALLHDPFLLLSFFKYTYFHFFCLYFGLNATKQSIKKKTTTMDYQAVNAVCAEDAQQNNNRNKCDVLYIFLYNYFFSIQMTVIYTYRYNFCSFNQRLIQTRTTCENVVKHSMKEMWDIFPGWNVSLWNRYLKGTFTGGKQTQLLKDTVAECINSPS